MLPRDESLPGTAFRPLLFEERWASRTTALPKQPGLIGFSLLRRRDALGEQEEPYTYSTATLWSSEASWHSWREGGGKSSHVASQQIKRTPVSEWMEGSASPIFWDVPIYLHRGGEEAEAMGNAEPTVHLCPRAAPKRRSGPLTMMAGSGNPNTTPLGEASWQAMRSRLKAYADKWGNADAPLGPEMGDPELGRWCRLQRQMRAAGRLDEVRIESLDELGFSWVAPADVDDPVQVDWADMTKRLIAYRDEFGDCDVPKKLQTDPELGGWVAAVRRNRFQLEEIGDGKVAELDKIGFVWVSKRQCGSAWMNTYRKVKEFHAEHGHSDVASVLGADHELAKWSESVRAQGKKGAISPKRMAYLGEINFGF